MGPFYILFGSLAGATLLFLLLDLAAYKKNPNYKPRVKRGKDDKLIATMSKTVGKHDPEPVTIEQTPVAVPETATIETRAEKKERAMDQVEELKKHMQDVKDGKITPKTNNQNNQ